MFDSLSANGKVLYMIANVLGARVTSGARSIEENTAVGGSPVSAHLKGDAIDIGIESPAIAVAALSLFGKGGVHQKGTAKHYHFEATEFTLPLFLGLMVFTTRSISK